MQGGDADTEAPGVYLLDPDDRWRLIHADRGGDYHLHDIKEAFALGTRATGEDGLPLLALSRAEARQLTAHAQAQALDQDDGLTALAADIAAAARDLPKMMTQLQLRQVF
ncbi:hypothetical protein CKO28_02075 [Rhodovibrio sodomensis]|uniref:Uncharacterized protein n=1 Tax=Rhodovibrio sodomensis TaxID=1088 RepID=A0ABS1DBN4_9PROT|nr:hypothetical protein [Rhodovibrio sodomensis]MBK1666830.1 hypothetical protein [Rhodovibrio sodomensis]